MYPGQLLIIKLCCPGCGQPQDEMQNPGSIFFAVNCPNKDCPTFGSEMLIERSTHTVAAVNRRYFKGHDGSWHRQAWEKIDESEVV